MKNNRINNIKKYLPSYIILALIVGIISYVVIKIFGIYAYLIVVSLLLANLWTDIGDALPSHVQMKVSTKFVHLSSGIARLINLTIKSSIKAICKNSKKIGINVVNFIKERKNNK